jgi:hypothetical protein
MVKGNDDLCNQAIKKINEHQPDWKINIKVDNDRLKYMQQNQNQQHRNPQQQMNPYQSGQQPQQRVYDQKGPQTFYPQQGYPPNDPNNPQQPYQAPSQQYLPPGTQAYYPQQNQAYQQQNLNEQPKIVGEKPGKILVREIWLGGIP